MSNRLTTHCKKHVLRMCQVGTLLDGGKSNVLFIRVAESPCQLNEPVQVYRPPVKPFPVFHLRENLQHMRGLIASHYIGIKIGSMMTYREIDIGDEDGQSLHLGLLYRTQAIKLPTGIESENADSQR